MLPGHGGNRPAGGLVTGSTGISASGSPCGGGPDCGTHCRLVFPCSPAPGVLTFRSWSMDDLGGLGSSTRHAAHHTACRWSLCSRQPNGGGPGCSRRPSTLGRGNSWCGEGDPSCAGPSRTWCSAAADPSPPSSLDCGCCQHCHGLPHLGRPTRPPVAGRPLLRNPPFPCQGHEQNHSLSGPLLLGPGRPPGTPAGRTESESETWQAASMLGIRIRIRIRIGNGCKDPRPPPIVSACQVRGQGTQSADDDDGGAAPGVLDWIANQNQNQNQTAAHFPHGGTAAWASPPQSSQIKGFAAGLARHDPELHIGLPGTAEMLLNRASSHLGEFPAVLKRNQLLLASQALAMESPVEPADPKILGTLSH